MNTEQTKLKELLVEYVKNPNDIENNWNLAMVYEQLGQLASAISFYIRTAERTKDNLLKVECLIRAAMCFTLQGTRSFTVKGLLQHAITILPKRPEAYYFLSKFYELEDKDGKWFDSYTTASLGLSFADHSDTTPFRTNMSYPGKYALLFQKARTAWFCGLCVDSKEMFLDLYTNYEMNDSFKTTVYQNLLKMKAFESHSIAGYTSEMYSKLKYNFNGANKIEKNYSEAYQDMFVLSVLNGKQNGTYIEIGAGDPTYGNNTYLLEKDFNWNGISLDINSDFVNAHNTKRKHTCILKDATTIEYNKLFTGMGIPQDIDYLQIDCDPPSVSFQVLLSIPFENYRFAVITFEHDHYADPDGNYREKSRKYLEAQGYKLVVSNVAPDTNRPYEDWYVHPELVDLDSISHIINVDANTKVASEFMLNG